MNQEKTDPEKKGNKEMTQADRERLKTFVEQPPYELLTTAVSVVRALIRIDDLEQQVTELQAKIDEITRRAVDTLCMCDKHTEISFDDFLAQHHCPLCCHAEKIKKEQEQDSSSQVSTGPDTNLTSESECDPG
jgi:hypothetical protein